MMTCAYHPGQPSSSHCQICGRLLCRACDHRIRGLPYCQDCIVEGVSLLQKLRITIPSDTAKGDGFAEGRRQVPALALLFSLFPGLGAVYNGQNVKALLLFSLIAGLEAIANQLTGSLKSLFTISGVGIYLYSLLDAFQSAKRGRRGVDLQHEDDEVRNLLRSRTHLVGLVLILAGSLVTLETLWPDFVGRFWPALLIVAGTIDLLRRRFEDRPG